MPWTWTQPNGLPRRGSLSRPVARLGRRVAVIPPLSRRHPRARRALALTLAHLWKPRSSERAPAHRPLRASFCGQNPARLPWQANRCQQHRARLPSRARVALPPISSGLAVSRADHATRSRQTTTRARLARPCRSQPRRELKAVGGAIARKARLPRPPLRRHRPCNAWPRRPSRALPSLRPFMRDRRPHLVSMPKRLSASLRRRPCVGPGMHNACSCGHGQVPRTPPRAVHPLGHSRADPREAAPTRRCLTSLRYALGRRVRTRPARSHPRAVAAWEACQAAGSTRHKRGGRAGREASTRRHCAEHQVLSLTRALHGPSARSGSRLLPPGA
mmetsp:Transcript_14775/g.43384  ORF Transcript_14775/g.43384 Transcript_14775/m.43384 type:complete len:331 (+) Transcript_14775:2859-3851(+)